MSRAKALGLVFLGCAFAVGCGSARAIELPDAGRALDAAGEAAATDADAASDAVRSARVAVEPDGHYTIRFENPAWTFAGHVGHAASKIVEARGTDGVGAYHETTFAFADASPRAAGIRAYDALPAVLFTIAYPEGATNLDAAFPSFDTYPTLPYHASYGAESFAPVTFTSLVPESPLVFFDEAANTFIVSAASNFMNSATFAIRSITSGIDPEILELPPGFSHDTLLVAGPGITASYATWGSVLLGRSGKTRAPSDANPTLERLGYWTDNGSTYFYRYDLSLGYEGTLLAVRDSFAELGVPLGYMQLDAWWYPKGPTRSWTHSNSGEYLYEADESLFPRGLAAFQRSLGLPLITHGKWVDPSSPYRAEHTWSNNVAIDPAFWNGVAGYIAAGGVAVYEQDFIDSQAAPSTQNLTDQDAYLDHMAQAMAAQGLTMQYCMPGPQHYLQSTKYSNLLTIRVSVDRFEFKRYREFLHESLLASSVGLWPWSDTFDSSETENLLLSTLSAGMVGVGDELGTTSVPNLLQAVRPDGVIVKPDAPLVPIDQSFIDEAEGAGTPIVGATFTDFGPLRASYVVAFKAGPHRVASFTPAKLGHSGRVFVYDYFARKGIVMEATTAFRHELADGTAYHVVVPVGPSGIALVGDSGKFVPLGKKRIPHLTDDGTLHITVSFAETEGPITLLGYSPSPPTGSALRGHIGPVAYDPATSLFQLQVWPDRGSALLTLR
jgi:hypothetical protein